MYSTTKIQPLSFKIVSIPTPTQSPPNTTTEFYLARESQMSYLGEVPAEGRAEGVHTYQYHNKGSPHLILPCIFVTFLNKGRHVSALHLRKDWKHNGSPKANFVFDTLIDSCSVCKRTPCAGSTRGWGNAHRAPGRHGSRNAASSRDRRCYRAPGSHRAAHTNARTGGSYLFARRSYCLFGSHGRDTDSRGKRRA